MYVGNFEYDDVNVFSEENFVLEVEEMFGRMLIKWIVENLKCGFDLFVKKVQNVFVIFERDDGVEVDVYFGEDVFMNEGIDFEVDILERVFDLRKGWNDDLQICFLDVVVCEEYEFF